MNKEQRKVFLELSGEVDWPLCVFCKYAEFLGSSCCDDGGVECTHNLADRYNFPSCNCELESGNDCWGFRPGYDPSFCAGVVGVILENGWDMASWWKGDDGVWRIIGRKAQARS